VRRWAKNFPCPCLRQTAMTLDRYTGFFDDNLDQVATRLDDLLADADRDQNVTTGRHQNLLRISS
jgi:hypothetical protein